MQEPPNGANLALDVQEQISQDPVYWQEESRHQAVMKKVKELDTLKELIFAGIKFRE